MNLRRSHPVKCQVFGLLILYCSLGKGKKPLKLGFFFHVQDKTEESNSEQNLLGFYTRVSVAGCNIKLEQHLTSKKDLNQSAWLEFYGTFNLKVYMWSDLNLFVWWSLNQRAQAHVFSGLQFLSFICRLQNWNIISFLYLYDSWVVPFPHFIGVFFS